MAVKIAGLWVDLQANIAKFTSDMDRAAVKNTAAGVLIAQGLGKISGALLNIGVRAATALPRLVENSIKTAEGFHEMSQRTGVATEALSALAFGAKQSGTSIEGLETGLRFLNKNMVAGAEGGKAQSAAFKSLGISVTDAAGKMRPAEEVLSDIAARFAGLPDGAQKSALALQIFGKSGTALIPLLNEGAVGLMRWRKEAEQLGLIIDSKTAKSADAFGDNLEKLKGAIEGIGLKLAAALLPNLERLTNGLIDFAKNSEGVQRVADSFKFLFQEIASGGVIAIGVMKQVLLGWQVLLEASAHVSRGIAKSLVFPTLGLSDFAKAGETIKERGADMSLNFSASMASLRAIWDETTGHLSATAKKTGDELEIGSAKAREALEKYLDDLKDQNITLGMSAGQLAAYKAAKLGASQADQIHAGALAAANELGKAALELTKERAASEWLEATMIRSKTAALGDLLEASIAITNIEKQRAPDLGQSREMSSAHDVEVFGDIAASAEKVAVAIGDVNARIEEHSRKISRTQSAWGSFGQQVSTVLTNMAQGIGDAIVSAKSLGDVFVQTAKRIASALVAWVIEGGIKKVLEWLDKLADRTNAVGGGGGGGILGAIGRGIGSVIGMGANKPAAQGGGTITTAPLMDDFSRTFGAVVDAVALGSERVSQGIQVSDANQRAIELLIGKGTFAGLEKITSTTKSVGIKLGSTVLAGSQAIVKAIIKGSWIGFAGQIIGSLIGLAGGGAGGGGMQHGGRPRLGMPVLVGEGGPELFVPDTWGTIMPNASLTSLREPASNRSGWLGFQDRAEQQPTVVHFHINGLISDDKLDRILEKMSRRIKYSGIVLESTASRTSPRRRS